MAVRRTGVALAGMFEAGRFRRVWLRLFKLLFSLSYMRGFAVAGGRRVVGPRIQLDITAREPIPAPTVAAPWSTSAPGTWCCAGAAPARGQWGPSLATEAPEKINSPFWRRGTRIPRLVRKRTAETDVSGVAVVFGPATRRRDSRYAGEFARLGATGPPAGRISEGSLEADR